MPRPSRAEMEARERAEARQTREQEEQVRRRKRSGGELHGRRLAVVIPPDQFKKFAFRWVNDKEARMIMLTKEDDWDLVPADFAQKDDNADLGNMISTPVGTHPDGSAMRAYLCRKLRTFYDDDQREKQEALDAQLSLMRSGNPMNNKDDTDYVPKTGIRIG